MKLARAWQERHVQQALSATAEACEVWMNANHALVDRTAQGLVAHPSVEAVLQGISV